MRFDDFDSQITCEEYYGEEPTAEDLDDVEITLHAWDQPYGDDDFDFPLFEADGGLTGDAQQMLGEMDSRGEFV